MQFILTEEEYNYLRKQAEDKYSMPNKDTLQRTCSYIADNWKTHKAFTEYDPMTQCMLGEMIPWGCILTVDFEHVCDDCPVQNICPLEHKSWSK